MEAPHLHCRHCGGPFGMVRIASEATCPYCGQRQTIDAAFVQRMREYASAVAVELEAAAAQDTYVTAADRFIQTYSTKKLGFAGMYALVAGVPLALGLGYFALTRARVLPVGPILSAAFVVATAAIIIVAARLCLGDKASVTAPIQVGTVAVACPECGAPNSMPVGVAGARCGSCGGQLQATAIAVDAGVEAALRAKREAMILRHRKAREVMLHVNRPPKFMGVLTLLWGMVLLGGSVYLAFGEGATEGWMVLVPSCVVVAIVAAWMLHRGLKERARLRAYRDLAQQFGSRVAYGAAPFITWLNQHWPSAYPIQHLYAHAHLVPAYTGFPVLVALRPDRAEALVAASTTNRKGSRVANLEKKRLQQMGFVVRIDDAGAWLQASPALMARLKRHVAAHRVFAPAVVHATRMLAAMQTR
ncbi:MAG: hypothetical protein AAF715_32290 [Myxococcota bacterium]